MMKLKKKSEMLSRSWEWTGGGGGGIEGGGVDGQWSPTQ